MWGDEAKRDQIVSAITHALASRDVRAKIRAATKRNWQNPEYRAKYRDDHFSTMARLLWQDPQMRDIHREKLARSGATLPSVLPNRKLCASAMPGALRTTHG
jgi:hypothetical protein